VEIIFHAHNAVMSDYMRQRAERAVRRLAKRLARAVSAVVRFEQDGPVRRVELVLHAPGTRALVAEGFGRTYGPALAEAADRMERQLAGAKRSLKKKPLATSLARA
jgi:ribosome-associated translation inhibitor RaiA